MLRLTCIFLVIFSLMFSGIANSADIPKRGTFSGRFGYFSVGKVFELEKQHIFFAGEFSGTFLNDRVGGLFDGAGVVCPGTNDVRLEKLQADAQGKCIITDVDGDHAYIAWQIAGPFPSGSDGNFEWTGGTGKYTGINGKNRFQCFNIPATSTGYCRWQANYELP